MEKYTKSLILVGVFILIVVNYFVVTVFSRREMQIHNIILDLFMIQTNQK